MAWDPVWESIFTSQAWGRYPGEDVIRFVAKNFSRPPPIAPRSVSWRLASARAPTCGFWRAKGSLQTASKALRVQKLLHASVWTTSAPDGAPHHEMVSLLLAI